jgi:hypothetical protein
VVLPRDWPGTGGARMAGRCTGCLLVWTIAAGGLIVCRVHGWSLVSGACRGLHPDAAASVPARRYPAGGRTEPMISWGGDVLSTFAVLGERACEQADVPR